MLFFIQLLSSFITSAAFGFLFSLPRRMIIPCGIVGMSGWATYLLCNELYASVVASSFAAAFAVTFISRLLAKKLKQPIILFNVPGIIPLVPGGLAYDAMRNMVENNYTEAIQLGVTTLMISGAVALGLVCSEVIDRVLQRMKQTHVRKVQ